MITDLALMGYHHESKRMQVESLHPGVTLEQVQENTGFDLEIPKDIPTTQAPTKEELDILQSKADPLAIRNFDSRNR